MSIYEARKIVKKLDLRKDVEWRKEISVIQEDDIRKRYAQE